MINGFAEVILLCILGVDLWMVASSRLLHCIKLVAVHGVLLGILPLALWNWEAGFPHTATVVAAAAGLLLKGILLPSLLVRAMRRAGVKRELEPLIGYSASLLLILAAGGIIFWLTSAFGIAPRAGSPLVLPCSFITMITGLFIIMARRKAITQVIGFLVFENGISIFGAGMMLEHGLLVEVGILLDVLVMVFVMGIALFQISREFRHIDADRLNQLEDSKNVFYADDDLQEVEE